VCLHRYGKRLMGNCRRDSVAEAIKPKLHSQSKLTCTDPKCGEYRGCVIFIHRPVGLVHVILISSSQKLHWKGGGDSTSVFTLLQIHTDFNFQ
jgi:hypothetical protein